MSDLHFSSYSVVNLQQYLKDRGVVFSDVRKPALIELCLFAKELGLEIDPDGLKEDRTDVISEKLTCSCLCLRNPDLLRGASNLSIVPNISIFDIYNYLLTFNEYDHAKLRAYHQMEGYTMAKDGYVVNLETVPYENTGHVAVKAHVKPRTNDKDPVSKKGYYSCWIIMKTSTEGSIQSAYCTCKGGIDGCCRHVVATLFEVLDFIEDFKSTSCTSGPCLWVRRASKADQLGKVISADEIDTSVTVNSSRTAPVPVYSPLPMDFPHPEPDVFFNRLKELQPNACALRVIFDCSNSTAPVQSLSCATPIEKAQQFVQDHTCLSDSCKCSNIFVYYHLMYSTLKCDEIEKSTRGQANNDNWHKMRKGLLTASNFHKIIHSTNTEKTAQSLLLGSSFDHTYVPDPISFGRRFEEKARDMYIKAHRFKHKLGNIKLNIPGLVLSKDDPILACSPDGIVHCKICGTFLVEIKCLYKYKHFHPKNALKMSNICIENEDKSLKLSHSHIYYDQIQGQMGVTGINNCVLVAYTHKGIHCVPVEFDSTFWESAKSVLHKFYHEAYFHVMLQSLLPKMSQ